MKASKIIFCYFPCRIVVCESADTPNCIDPETKDLREYARIVPHTVKTGGIWLSRFEFAGDIEWTKHADMLTEEQRAVIEHVATCCAARDFYVTEKAIALQHQQRIKYADKIAKYGEDNA